MKICITGASGLIGGALTQHLEECGHEIFAITRTMLRGEQQKALQHTIEQSEVVINLAGESIDQRWSPAAKLRIIESRTRTTRTVVAAINRCSSPKHLISASAVGIYPSIGCHNDYSRLRGNTFLTDVCQAWEAEANRLEPHHTLSITRFGVVLTPKGGALNKMTATARFGFMPKFGAPTRHISWIDIDDLTRAIAYIIESSELHGAINLCAPELTTQALFLRAVDAPIRITLPLSILRLIRGEASILISQSCCTTPLRLTSAGFTFNSPTIESLFEKIKK